MADIEFISILTLIQSPEKYHHKRVRIVALCTLEFEGKAMWVSKEALDKAITKDAVWLDVNLDDKTKKLDRRVVIVEGTFDATRKGHLGMYSGMIGDVTRVDLWEKETPGGKF
jgi:hypothetical protein